MYQDATPITTDSEPPPIEITEAADQARFRVAGVNAPQQLEAAPGPSEPEQGASEVSAEPDVTYEPDLGKAQAEPLAFDTYEPETAPLSSEGLVNNGE